MNWNIELAKWAVKGHAPAVKFLAHIYDIAHIADDIADGDTPDVMRSVETLLSIALVDLPDDPFYRENYERLQPLVANAITHWAAANAYEKSKNPMLLERAFILRSMYATLTIAAAQIVAGPMQGMDWARTVAARVWNDWTDETVGTYLQEHMAPEGANDVRENSQA